MPLGTWGMFHYIQHITESPVMSTKQYCGAGSTNGFLTIASSSGEVAHSLATNRCRCPMSYAPFLICWVENIPLFFFPEDETRTMYDPASDLLFYFDLSYFTYYFFSTTWREPSFAKVPLIFLTRLLHVGKFDWREMLSRVSRKIIHGAIWLVIFVTRVSICQTQPSQF